LFNDHTYCSDEWCPVLIAKRKQHEYKGVYRSKVKHAREYEQIKSALAPYLTDEKLNEIHHTFDSQKNESFNKSASKYAPKGHTYSMTMALTARISIAASVGNVGAHEYWSRVLERLGIDKGDHTEAFLLDKNHRSKYKHEYQCHIPVKRCRAEKRSQKWREILKKQGNEEKVGITYKTRVRNSDGGEDSNDDRPSKRIRLYKTVCKKSCVRCGRWDHMKLCKSCPDSEDYSHDLDALYNEWETKKRLEGKIPDIAGGEGKVNKTPPPASKIWSKSRK
jgi:hypothetical protein